MYKLGRPSAGARYGLLFTVILMIGVFSVLRPDTYFTVRNLQSIASTNAIPGVMALAVVGVLAVGEFDLSFASIFGLTQVLVIGLIVNQGMPWVTAVIIILLIGLVSGFANGVMTVGLKVSSFVGTLAVASIIGGISNGYTGGQIIVGDLPSGFKFIGQTSVGSIGLNVFVTLTVAVLLHILLEYTATGRRMFAVGGNRSAARLAGININRSVTLAFVLAGFIAAIAAVMSGSFLGSAQPLVGSSALLPAYAGAFLGATTITPGRFNVWGTLIGVYMLGAGVAGLQQLGLAVWVQQIFNGVVLAVAVAVSGYLTRRPGRSVALPEAAEPAPAID